MFDLSLSHIYNEKEASETALYMKLYHSIRKDIESGRLSSNEKLPSIRILAGQLNLSRTTIENAYHQLHIEGYIYSLEKRGYYVSELDHQYKYKPSEKKSENQYKETDNYNETYLDDGNFDYNIWKKYYNQVLAYMQKRLMTSGEPQGEMALREEIAKYVYASRGVKCQTSQIIIGAGVQVLIGILSAVLKDVNCSDIAFEEPGFTDVRPIFEDHHFKTFPVKVEAEGIDIALLKKSGAKVCYVSPSHQFPTGLVMPVNARLKLLKWAEENKGYIIEDDYDSELRYSGRPVPSLQGLDKHNSVIYFGSFSTIFLPSMRISYMILPEQLLTIYFQYRDRYNQTTSKADQLALALYMSEGHFERHLRRMRTRFASKLEKLVQAMENILYKDIQSGRFTIYKSDSGVDLLLKIKASGDSFKTDRQKLLNKAEEMGIKMSAIGPGLLLLRYAYIPEDKISDAVRKLFTIEHTEL